MIYEYDFIGKYVEIPSNIDEKVDTDYSNEKPEVRHCVKLLITNLLLYGEVAYSRNWVHLSDTEKERILFHIHKLSNIIRDYMRNKGITEYYNGEMSDRVHGLTQWVLRDLNWYCGNEDPDVETNLIKNSYEVITKTLGKEFPCLGIASWNDKICHKCKIRFSCYTSESINSPNLEQKRQWVLDQISKGIGSLTRCDGNDLSRHISMSQISQRKKALSECLDVEVK